MSFDTLKVKLGRRPVVVVELDLDFCANEYGVSPCTASGGAGDQCFNTLKTCQDTPNFNKTTKTFKFCSNTAFLPIGENIYPCVTGTSIAPTQLNPKGVSVNASVTVNLQDFTDHDRGVDPYAQDRAYIPEDQGTFFGKLRARNPFTRNRVMRVNTGYVDNDRAIYTQNRTYFIDRIEGPDANGRVKIVGRGRLSFATDENMCVPAKPTATVQSSIGTGTGSLVLLPAGIGNALFPTSGRVRIENEVIQFSARSGDTLTMSVRGSDSTTAASHIAGKPVTLCDTYSTAAVRIVPEMIHHILTSYAAVDSSYIDLTAWIATATAAGQSGDSSDELRGRLNAVLAQPTSVQKMLEQICKDHGCYIWWDEVDAEIKFGYVGPYDTSAPTIDEERNILGGSLSIKDLEKERITSIAQLFNLGDVISSDPADLSYQYFLLTVDANREGKDQYGETAKVEVKTRWSYPTTYGAYNSVQDVHDRMLSWFGSTPREFSFALDAKDADYKTGDQVYISTRLVQDEEGENLPVLCIITEVEEAEPGHRFKCRAQQIQSTI